MLFFLDENVPAAVREVLTDAGHEAEFIRTIIPEGSPDELVATTSEQNGAILISFDKDFKKISPRIPDGQKARFKRLSIIRMECKKPRAAQRIQTALPFIELQHKQSKDAKSGKFIISVRDDTISLYI